MTELDVMAIDVLPVVSNSRKPGKPGISDTWSADQLKLLVHLREKARKNWAEVAHILKRPLSTCHRRYAALVRDRAPVESPTPKPLSAATPRKRLRLYEELGIKTYSVYATVVDARGNITSKKVTLSAGLVP
jgi:hypothetical protein